MLTLLFLLTITLNPSGVATLDYGNTTITTNNLTYKEGPLWKVVVEEEAYVYLPEGAAFVDGEGVQELFVDKGRLVAHVSPSGFVVYELSPQREDWPLYVLALLAVIAFYLWKRPRLPSLSLPGSMHLPKGGAPFKDGKGILRLLSEREAKAYTLITKYPGICFKDLLNMLGWPKSTLSVVLKRLEAKGLIKGAKKGLSKCYYPAELQE